MTKVYLTATPGPHAHWIPRATQVVICVPNEFLSQVGNEISSVSRLSHVGLNKFTCARRIAPRYVNDDERRGEKTWEKKNKSWEKDRGLFRSTTRRVASRRREICTPRQRRRTRYYSDIAIKHTDHASRVRNTGHRKPECVSKRVRGKSLLTWHDDFHASLLSSVCSEYNGPTLLFFAVRLISSLHKSYHALRTLLALGNEAKQYTYSDVIN